MNIEIGKNNLTKSFCIDSKYIYLSRTFNYTTKLLIIRHNIKYKNKYIKNKKLV